MIWAVLDTNTLVSGLGWSGPPSQIIDHALAGHFMLVLSEEILEEFERVLHYPRLVKHFPEPDDIVQLMRATCVLVEPATELQVLDDDPDNRILEAAQAGHVDFVITGDRRFLLLGNFEGAQIVLPRTFLTEVEKVL